MILFLTIQTKIPIEGNEPFEFISMSKEVLNELVCIRGRVVLLILLLPFVSIAILYMNHSHELLMKDEDI